MRAFLLIGVAVLLVVATSQDEKVRQEHKKLAGRWVLEAAEVDGKPVADEHLKKSQIIHSDGECTLDTPHQSPQPIKARISIDPTKTPKEMDFVRSAGPNAGKTIPAIYEFQTDDKYKVCFDPTGKERPKEFTTRPGSGHILHVWTRPKE
jgi:uncharacterized protein (TIGR03067 family)